MRVIAGTAKGRRISAPPGDSVRPTSDRVKEALFSSIAPLLPDARVLDLYAGSGSLGIEALSRGATHATLVEQDRVAAQIITDNLAIADVGDRAVVIERRVRDALGRALPGGPFDIVFADPPYSIEREVLAKDLALLKQHLAAGATVVVELGKRDTEPEWPGGISLVRSRDYGSTRLYFAATADPDDQDSDTP